MTGMVERRERRKGQKRIIRELAIGQPTNRDRDSLALASGSHGKIGRMYENEPQSQLFEIKGSLTTNVGARTLLNV